MLYRSIGQRDTWVFVKKLQQLPPNYLLSFLHIALVKAAFQLSAQWAIEEQSGAALGAVCCSATLQLVFAYTGAWTQVQLKHGLFITHNLQNVETRAETIFYYLSTKINDCLTSENSRICPYFSEPKLILFCLTNSTKSKDTETQ